MEKSMFPTSFTILFKYHRVPAPSISNLLPLMRIVTLFAGLSVKARKLNSSPSFPFFGIIWAVTTFDMGAAFFITENCPVCGFPGRLSSLIAVTLKLLTPPFSAFSLYFHFLSSPRIRRFCSPNSMYTSPEGLLVSASTVIASPGYAFVGLAKASITSTIRAGVSFLMINCPPASEAASSLPR